MSGAMFDAYAFLQEYYSLKSENLRLAKGRQDDALLHDQLAEKWHIAEHERDEARKLAELYRDEYERLYNNLISSIHPMCTAAALGASGNDGTLGKD